MFVTQLVTFPTFDLSADPTIVLPEDQSFFYTAGVFVFLGFCPYQNYFAGSGNFDTL